MHNWHYSVHPGGLVTQRRRLTVCVLERHDAWGSMGVMLSNGYVGAETSDNSDVNF